jgi:hypothetical protein
VDVVYPGYLPYKNLGIAEDLSGYSAAQKRALSYDFSTFVGGHVTRLGAKNDVELSIEFYKDLQRTTESSLNEFPMSDFARNMPAGTPRGSTIPDKWDLHNEYEKALVDRCYANLLPRWKDRLADTETYLRDNCWSMMENVIVTLVPGRPEQEH